MVREDFRKGNGRQLHFKGFLSFLVVQVDLLGDIELELKGKS